MQSVASNALDQSRCTVMLKSEGTSSPGISFKNY